VSEPVTPSLDSTNSQVVVCRSSESKLLELRNHYISNEAVYITQSLAADAPVGLPVAELYLTASLWFEVEMRLFFDGDTHFNCVFAQEMLDLDTGLVWNENRHRSGVKGNEAMLIEIAKSIQLPEGMLLRATSRLLKNPLPLDG